MKDCGLILNRHCWVNVDCAVEQISPQICNKCGVCHCHQRSLNGSFHSGWSNMDFDELLSYIQEEKARVAKFYEEESYSRTKALAFLGKEKHETA